MRRRGVLAVGLLTAVLLVAAAALTGCGGDVSGATPTASPGYTIGIIQIVSHPALDAAVAGFKQAMSDAETVAGEDVAYVARNADGDASAAARLAQELVAQQPDLLLAVDTPTAKALVETGTQTPIVFAGITDPVGAGLVQHPQAPEANVTGVSDLLPVDAHLALIKRIVPRAATIGVLYNPDEANSVTLVKAEKEEAAAAGLDLVAVKVRRPEEVRKAAMSLVGRVDAVSVLTDNTVVAALDDVLAACREAQVPLICGDADSVRRGAVAAYSFDGRDMGREAAGMGVQILRGVPVAEIAVRQATDLTLAVNLSAARAMGVKLPDDVVAEADTTY